MTDAKSLNPLPPGTTSFVVPVLVQPAASGEAAMAYSVTPSDLIAAAVPQLLTQALTLAILSQLGVPVADFSKPSGSALLAIL